MRSLENKRAAVSSANILRLRGRPIGFEELGIEPRLCRPRLLVVQLLPIRRASPPKYGRRDTLLVRRYPGDITWPHAHIAIVALPLEVDSGCCRRVAVEAAVQYQDDEIAMSPRTLMSLMRDVTLIPLLDIVIGSCGTQNPRPGLDCRLDSTCLLARCREVIRRESCRTRLDHRQEAARKLGPRLLRAGQGAPGKESMVVGLLKDVLPEAGGRPCYPRHRSRAYAHRRSREGSMLCPPVGSSAEKLPNSCAFRC